MSTQALNIAIGQSFPADFVVRIQALSRAYLVRKDILPKYPSRRLSPLSSPPSLRSLSRQARYARAEAALRSALLKSESEPNPLVLQIRVMQNGLAAWNTHVILGQQRVEKAERAMVALQAGDQSPALARVSLSELQKEKWMGIKERDEALEMVKKIKQLIDELGKELQSGSKRSTLIPTPICSNEAEERPSSKAKILFSGRFPYPYLERLPRSRHSVEPLRLPFQHEESRRRASSLSSPSKLIPNSPLSASSSSSSSSAVSINEDCFGAVLIYPSDRLRTPDKRELQDHFRLPSYVDSLLGELSEDRLGAPKFDFNSNILRAMSGPATPASQKTAPSSYQAPATPKPKTRVLLRHRLSNLSISTFKNNQEPSTPRSSTGTFVYVPESTPSTTPLSPSTPPMTPRKKLSKIESVMDSVKKSVKRVSFRQAGP